MAGEKVLVFTVDGFYTKVKLVEDTLSFAFLIIKLETYTYFYDYVFSVNSYKTRIG